MQKLAEPPGRKEFADVPIAKPHGAIDDTVKYRALQQGLNIAGLPFGQNCLRFDAGPCMNAIRDLDARFASENDGGRKTLGAIQGLG